MYSPAASLTDPPAASPIADGILWVQSAVLGSTATAVAVIVVAAIGLLMLTGRLELRRGTTVVLGCFILFGAGGIAQAVTGLASAESGPVARASIQTPPLQQLPPAPSSSAYDPYAGASVPVHR